MSSLPDDSDHVLHTDSRRPQDGNDLDPELDTSKSRQYVDMEQMTLEHEDDPDVVSAFDNDDQDDVDGVEAEELRSTVDETMQRDQGIAHVQVLEDDDEGISSSIDETASIPDDTPSAHGSVLSSPRSEEPSLATPARRGSPSSPHRPFDRRFQSRISSSPLMTPRARSPAFLHSRQSSIASLAFPPPSEPDESTAPWEVIRWNKLKKLTAQAFSETAKRNFGHPTCLAVTDSIVVGTSRGMILIFDHQQTPRASIGAGTKALESGPVTALAISADHTAVVAGHGTGHIFTWEIARPTKPFLSIPPIDASLPQARRGDGHVAGCAVVHVGFLGYRRTALVSADDRGMAFSHLATRGMGAVARTVKTTRVLGRYPEVISRSSKPLKKSSVLAFSPLPLGNIEQRTDVLGLVAMLTPYLLVIVSTTPIAQTQHKAARPKEVEAHSAMTAALAWFPAIKLKGVDAETSKVKLAYAWSNVLTILEVHEDEPVEPSDKAKPPDLQFLPRSRFQAEEAIVAVQWLSRSVLAVLTITQQLLILDEFSMTISDSFDLLPKNIYHADLFSQQLQAVIENLDEEDTSMHGVVADAFHMSFRAYKGRLFLLGFNDIWWGSLTNWADRLLALMNIGDFIAAIRLATRYYAGHGEKLTIGLPEDEFARKSLVGERLFEMITASLKYAFGKNQQAGNVPVGKPQLAELAEVCITACLATNDQDFLFSEVFSWYEDHQEGPLFVDVLEPYILDATVSIMPPPALKVLIDHFAITHTPAKLEEIICLLDTSSMDLDQVTTLCKKYNLFDAYIYVWNKSLADFITPLEELLRMASDSMAMNGHSNGEQRRTENAQKIFPYLSFVLTSRTYPTGLVMDDNLSDSGKAQIYEFFFSAIPNKGERGRSRTPVHGGILPYSNLRKILEFDTPSFISTLNEAFEDSFLNPPDDDALNGTTTQLAISQKTTFNRQFIVKIMLEVMASGFDVEDTIYLDMFVARNLPKYTQYMLLSGTTMQEVFTRLCHYPERSMRGDAQLSVEYLLAVYQPSNLHSLVPLLHEAGFYRVLKSVYRKDHQYADVVAMYFADTEDQEDVFDVLAEFLHAETGSSDVQKGKIVELVQEHAEDLIRLDVRRTATTIDSVADNLHQFFLNAVADDTYSQFEYLTLLFEPGEDAPRKSKKRPAPMLELYIRLMCQYHSQHVPEFVETVKEGDLRLNEVIPAMEETGVIDAAVILQARSGHNKDAMGRLTAHLSSLQSALRGLTDTVDEATGSHVDQTTQDLLSSIQKYAQVGIWLCQSQSKASQARKPVSKSPRRSSSAQLPLSFEETLWLALIESIVSMARDFSEVSNVAQYVSGNQVLTSLRSTIQQVFTTLLTSTTSARASSGSSDGTFLRILRAFLSNAAKVSPSLSELRAVLNSIFSAYAYEESLLALSNSMLDKDVFVHLDDVQALRQKGWRPRGQVCEVCRNRVWGPGIGGRVWEIWQKKEQERQLRRDQRGQVRSGEEADTSRGKGKAADSALAQEERVDVIASEDAMQAEDSSLPPLGPIAVFRCRHMYHVKCLQSKKPSDNDNGEDDAATNDGDGVRIEGLRCPQCIAGA